MPTNQELAVILKFRDEMSAAFTRTTQAAGRQLDQLGKGLKDFGSHMTQLGRNMRFLGLEITGFFAVSLAIAQRYSVQAGNAIRDLNAQNVRLHLTIANALVPVLQSLTVLLSRIANAFEHMDSRLRDSIIQWVAITGVVLLFQGQLIKTIGAIAKIGGAILVWLAALNPVRAALVASAIAILSLLAVTGQLGNALAVLARILDFVANAFAQLIELALLPARYAMEGFAVSVRLVLEGLALFPGPLQKNIQALRDWSRAVERETRRAADQGVKNMMAFGKQAMEAAAGTGKGAGAPFTEMIRKARDMVRELRRIFSPKEGGDIATGFIQAFQVKWKSFVDETMDLGSKAGTALAGFFHNVESTIGRSVENAILHGGKLKNVLKEIARGIVQAFVSMIAQLIAAAAVFLILSAIPGMTAFLKFLDTVAMARPALQVATTSAALANARNVRATTVHSGGFIQRFAGGGEVLAMLEPGEFVVNRRSTERNRELLDSINSGRASPDTGGGKGIAVVFNINAIDPKTGAEFLLRNSKAIADAVGQEILRNNQSYRRTSRRFA